ncbi:hypothetical protein WOLCODRAFT_152245 [Wolfiporia cocos MD-104 SS10]|uniref:Uncharacterized protein n=1 Tax=Wolfiporia cocos (strain MD-104) TaxID=742152 RepID=A0A2H3JWI1_WOLCO|nr:hypothetical protein WOLCODRAFT_152245 [Wolfiporia cocos MD-104 SS10]
MSSQQALEAVTPHLRRPFVAGYPLFTVAPTLDAESMLECSGHFETIQNDAEGTLRVFLAYYLVSGISRKHGYVSLPHFEGLVGTFRPEVGFQCKPGSRRF